MRRNGAERHYAVDFGRDGTVISEAAPSPLNQVSLHGADQMRSVVDQVTAYFRLEKQLTAGGTCVLVVPVFGGSALYDLRSNDVRREVLSADEHQNFAGPSRLCAVTRENLVASPDRNEDTYQRDRIWYAPLISGEMTPVRMEFTTALGVVKAYLAEIRGHGVDLHLARE